MAVLRPVGTESRDTESHRRRYEELLGRPRSVSPTCCRGEWTVTNFWLGYPDPDAFVSSQWLRPSALYAAYRILLALYFVVWFIISWVHLGMLKGVGNLCYLTEWSNDVLTVSLVLRAGLACHGYNRQTRKTPTALPRMTRVLKLSWVLYNVSSGAALAVTVNYWTLVFDASKMTSNLDWALSIQRHAIQSVFVIIDLMVTAFPVRIFHLYQPVIYSCIYGFFSAAYNLSGNPPIYVSLDWVNEPMKATTNVLVSGFAVISAGWLVLYGVYILRCVLYDKFYGKKKKVPTATLR